MTLLPSSSAPPPSRHSHPWRWVGIVIAAIIVIAILALWLLLHSGRFQRYLVQTAESRASASLGTPVHIGHYTLHIHGFSSSVDLYDIFIAGKPVPGEPTPAPPLLHIAHAQVAIRITSLIHRSWQLEHVELDKPVVHLFVNARGQTNLPTPPPSAQPGSTPAIFQLGIHRVAIRQGSVIVNDRTQALGAMLQGAQLTLAFQPRSHSYSGQFGYASGQITLAHTSPIPTSLSARFSASPQGVSVPSLRLTVAGSQLTAQVHLTRYAPPQLNLSYQARLDLSRLRPLLHQPALPLGTLSSNGSATYNLGQIRAHGQFSSSLLQLRFAPLNAPLRAIRGSYNFDAGTLHVNDLHAEILGGQLSSNLQITAVGQSNETARISMSLHGAELGQLARLAPQSSTTLRDLGITGTLDSTADTHWQGSLQNLEASAQLTLAARFAPAGNVPTIPLHLTANIAYTAAHGLLTLRHTSIQTPSSNFSLTGSLATQDPSSSHLHLDAHSDNLTAVESLADRIADALAHSLPSLALAGQGSVQASIHGALTAPQITGHLALTNLSLRSTHWPSLKTQFSLSPSQAAVQDMQLVAPHGHIQLSGSLGLDHWQPQAASPLHMVLSIEAFPMAQLAPLLPHPLPISGVLQAQVQVTGTLAAPLGQAQARLSSVRLHLGSGAPRTGLQSLSLSAHTAAGVLTAQLEAVLTAGLVHISGSLHPANGSYSVSLAAPALVLAKVPAFAQFRVPVSGTLTLHGSGQGTFANPGFDIEASSPALSVSAQAIGNFRFHAQLQAQSLNATVTASVLQTALAGQAHVALRGAWPTTASLNAPAVPLTPLLLAFTPQASAGGLSGATALQVRLSGPLLRPAALQVAITLPSFELHYSKAWNLAAQGPIQAHLADGVIQLQPAHLVGTDTDLRAQARIPIPALGAIGAIQASLTGSVNLALAQAFAPDLTAAGQLQLNLSATGMLDHPEVSGDLKITQASLSNPGWPVSVERGQGTLRLHQNRVDLVGFTATVGGGNVALGGGFAFAPKPQFNLSIAASQIRLRFPPSLRDTIGADLTLTGTPSAAVLTGRVRIDDVAPAPGFDFATLTRQLAQSTVTAVAPNSFLRNLHLQIALTTPNQIHITSRDFSLAANATLNLRGSALEPVVLGRVALTSGDLIFRGNRYLIQSGTLDFLNPIRTVPTVNLTADTTIQQYDLHLRFQGPTDNLRVSYTSDPALPPADIINLLAFGQTTEAAAANPLPGNLGAESIVAGAVSGQITDRISRIAGISHLSVDPVLGGGQQNAGARITIQQRVTGSLYVTISTDVTSTQRNVIEVQYHLAPNVSLSGIRKQNGGFGVNLRFKKTWH